MKLFHPVAERPRQRADGASIYILVTDGLYVATARYRPWSDDVASISSLSENVCTYYKWNTINATHWCYVSDLVSLI